MSVSQTPIDWNRVYRWTAQIISGDVALVQSEFPEVGRPTVAWSPAPEALVSDKLRFFATYWNDLRRDAALPAARDVDPLQMRPILGYVMLLDPVEGGRDFRYTLFGSVIAQVSEMDLTGQYASAMVASPAVVELGLAAYRAVFQRREPLYVIRSPIGAYRTAQWHRLTLPLADDRGAVARLIAVNLPIAHDGKLIG